MMEPSRYLMLDLESPLSAYGREMVDAHGFTGRFPTASMLTGLLGNALGYERTEGRLLQDLQDRLVFAARLDRESPHGLPITDYQTAVLYMDEKHWTTSGEMEGRAESETYTAARPGERRKLTWPRWREYHTDARVTVALRLEPAGPQPDLEALAAALDEPARPLFIGRKNCVPTRMIMGGFSEGENALLALLAWPLDPEDQNTMGERGWGQAADGRPLTVRTTWDPRDAGWNAVEGVLSYEVSGKRNWTSRLHGGTQIMHEARMPREAFAATFPAPAPDRAAA
jgi:CRISPR system Cascade subunit CasD